MKTDFKNLEYLKKGNPRQRLAFSDLTKFDIFNKLEGYKPILTGTVPIDIDIPESDLDIICHCKDPSEFTKSLLKEFRNKDAFQISTTTVNEVITTVARFKTPNFEIEIFGQNVPSEKQNAYKHMLIEHWILEQKGPKFRSEIRKLKLKGLKTEPAFAQLLGLPGNPFDQLLELYKSNIDLIIHKTLR